MKKYKHKQTGDIAIYNGSRYVVAELGNLYVPDRYIENSNDWELIKPTIEVGKIYKSSKTPVIVLIKEEVDSVDAKCIGFDGFGNWCKLSYFSIEHLVEATKEEWFERLKEEAVKRGLVKGARFKGLFSSNILDATGCMNLSGMSLKNCLETGQSDGYLMDAVTGKWATLIEEKKPILTTHDGVELFDGDKYWYVTSDFYGKRRKLREGDVLKHNFVRFSTKEKAQEYIDLHQKKYSLADLQDALNNLKNK